MAQFVSNPEVNAPIVGADPTPSIQSKVTTFILQKTTGTATAGELIEDISVNAEDALAGANSQGATAIREFRKKNKVSQINAIFLDDAVGAKASGSIVFTGTATASGTIQIYVGNEDRSYPVTVAIGDDADAVGTSFEALVTADALKALVTGVNTLGAVVLEAVNSGTQGNDIGIRIDSSVAGITSTLTGFSGGAGDPLLTGLEDELEDRTDVITHAKYAYGDILDLLDARFNANNIILDGRLLLAETDSKANLVILGNSENSQCLIVEGDKPVSKATKTGSAIFAMPYQKIAKFQSIRTLRLEDGQIITAYVTTKAPRDQFGGSALNSLPYFNTPMDLPIIPTREGFTGEEVKDLTEAGISVFGNNPAKNQIITDKVVTTYKTDTAGNLDATYKFLNYVDTSTACREYIFNALKIDYAQSRLTNGSAINGRDIATKGRVRSDFMGYLDDLGGENYTLLQWGTIEETGELISDVVKRNLVIDFDVEEGLIYISSILPIMTQARKFLVPLQIVFDVTKA